MIKLIGGLLFFFGLLYLLNMIKGGEEYANREINALFFPDKLPENSDDFTIVNKNVGCVSKFNEDKKRKIYIDSYENHFFKWIGTVVSSTSNSVKLDLNKDGKTNIEIDLEENEGFNLEKNQQVKVSFVLVGKPHCGSGLNISSYSYAFSGRYGKVLR